jgi:hypothetical protein
MNSRIDSTGACIPCPGQTNPPTRGFYKQSWGAMPLASPCYSTYSHLLLVLRSKGTQCHQDVIRNPSHSR